MGYLHLANLHLLLIADEEKQASGKELEKEVSEWIEAILALSCVTKLRQAKIERSPLVARRDGPQKSMNDEIQEA